MSDKVIVNTSDINDLPFVEQEHSGDKYVLLEDIKHWLEDATPVSGEVVEETNAFDYELLAMELAEQEHDDIHQLIYEGYPPEPSREVWQNYINDAKSMIAMVSKYTTPQPAPDTVPEGYTINKIEWIDRAVKEATDSIKSDVLSIISEYESRFKKSLAKSLDDYNKAMKGE